MKKLLPPPPDNNHVRAERFAESVWVRLGSRVAMIAVTVAIPLIAYFGNRTMISLDEAVKTINETATRVLVMQQQMTDSGLVYTANTNQIKTQLDDHEARIRALERGPKR
jgi:hypothetical protein